MADRIRDTDPNKIHLVTIRTQQAALLLRPGLGLEEILGGIVARYQEQFKTEVYAYNFLGNHYHILARGSEDFLWKFAQGVNREIARRVNYIRYREGKFWGRKYDDQIVVEVQDATEAFLYITTNATHHGLVSHPIEWPGLNSYWQSLTERSKKYAFTHYTEYSKALRKARRRKEVVRVEDFQTIHTLSLTPLPEFKGLSSRQRISKLKTLIEERIKRITADRKNQGQTAFLGRDAVLAQDPFQTPMKSKRSPRPLCYTKSFTAKLIFMEEYFSTLANYKEASIKFRSGQLDTEFPPHTIKPPLLYLL